MNDMLTGILPVNKPGGWTSFDVAGKLRGVLHTKKIGHGGTLDPMATGVLPVLVGKATKCFGIMPDSSKSYTAGFRLGLSTDTQDISGSVLSESDKQICLDEINRVLETLRGDIMQIPPMYSAVKVGGRKLYELAREGRVIEREPRPARVDRLEVTAYDEQSRSGTLEIDCGKGTYVRTIIHDLGEALGCGGVMTTLVRTRSDGITLDRCLTIPEIEKLCENGIPGDLLIPVDTVFSVYDEIRLGEHETRLYKNGVRLRPDQTGREICPGLFRVYGSDGGFLGTGGFEGGDFRCRTNFY